MAGLPLGTRACVNLRIDNNTSIRAVISGNSSSGIMEKSAQIYRSASPSISLRAPFLRRCAPLRPKIAATRPPAHGGRTGVDRADISGGRVTPVPPLFYEIGKSSQTFEHTALGWLPSSNTPYKGVECVAPPRVRNILFARRPQRCEPGSTGFSN